MSVSNRKDLFNRRCTVTIDSIKIECGDGHGLDCSFSIQKTLKVQPNTGSLTVTNLNPDHRGQLTALVQKGLTKPGAGGKTPPLKGVRVRIEAGYASGTSRIFEGDIAHVWHEVVGADVVTHFESSDGTTALKNARLSKSYAAGTPFETVLKDVGMAMGVGTGNLLEKIAGVLLRNGSPAFSQGTCVTGSVAKELNRLTKSAGLEWSIQDGVLQLLETAGALSGTAVVVSAETGMVGSPQLQWDKGEEGVHVKTLMIPDVFPGRKVRIESASVNGVYRVVQSTYVGDTKGQDWYLELDAKRLS